MSAGWIAGSVRARLLLGRRLGPTGARDLAAAPSFEAALPRLAGSAYARAAGPGPDLRAVQHEVATVTLLQLRLLAGWLPRGAAELLRPLAGWFELMNVEDRFAYLEGGDLKPTFELGSLASAWPEAALAQSVDELCDVLAASAWDYRGGPAAEELHTALRLAWATRILAVVPEARAWVAGAIALMLARGELDGAPTLAAESGDRLGPFRWQAPETVSLDGLRAGLPADASWPLAGVEAAEELWRAEAAWWLRVETEATTFAHGPRADRSVIVGAVALLALDAVRVNAALEVAAHGGTAPAKEAFDALC